eukprot:Polyplicarium_translucidae@DN2272_c0_g1_i2.p2
MLFPRIGWNSERDMLGEEQWKWLENELGSSKAAVNVIVSSVQVRFSVSVATRWWQMMTPVSFFESWGHFPKSLDRLVAVLRKTRPHGLMVISGDVHFAQILGQESGILEITSSGMTHTILENKVAGPFLTEFAIPLSGSHKSVVQSFCPHNPP